MNFGLYQIQLIHIGLECQVRIVMSIIIKIDLPIGWKLKNLIKNI